MKAPECNEKFYVGVDLSLVGTGIVIIDHTGRIVNQTLLDVKSEWYECPEQHLNDIIKQCKFIANVVRVEKVAIEGLSYMSLSKTAHERTALNFMLRCYLYRRGVPFEIVPPKTLKKWTTNNGNATKDDMMKTALERWGAEFTDDNLCDAYCLARYIMNLDGCNEDL